MTGRHGDDEHPDKVTEVIGQLHDAAAPAIDTLKHLVSRAREAAADLAHAAEKHLRCTPEGDTDERS